MDNLWENTWFINILSGLVVSTILFLSGYLIGKRREKRRKKGKRLEEYTFYPFTIDAYNFPGFDLDKFSKGVEHFLSNYNYSAARQLIFIGEQNNVRYHLQNELLIYYQKLFKKYNGEQMLDDNTSYLENYKQMVKLIGKTFRGLGIEILLHNLVNPAKSIVAIENPITGRAVEDGTTSLVLDLKKRNLLNQDKLNYELNLGARRFKCTTIPIFRKNYGLIAAICINIDVNYITEEVLQSKEKIESFFKNYCKTDMKLDENILSKYEYTLALDGKKHWMQT